MTVKLNIALVGLGFGSCFTEIYQNHPDVETLTLCDADPQRLEHHATKRMPPRCAGVNLSIFPPSSDCSDAFCL